MTIRSETKSDVLIIFIEDVRLVNEASIEQCYREIVELLERTNHTNMLIHFGRVAFMSSTALGMLIRVYRKCVQYSITLKLCNIAPDIYQAFKITSLNKIFEIHPDSAHAMTAFKAASR